MGGARTGGGGGGGSRGEDKGGGREWRRGKGEARRHEAGPLYMVVGSITSPYPARRCKDGVAARTADKRGGGGRRTRGGGWRTRSRAGRQDRPSQGTSTRGTAAVYPRRPSIPAPSAAVQARGGQGGPRRRRGPGPRLGSGQRGRRRGTCGPSAFQGPSRKTTGPGTRGQRATDALPTAQRRLPTAQGRLAVSLGGAVSGRAARGMATAWRRRGDGGPRARAGTRRPSVASAGTGMAAAAAMIRAACSRW